MGAAGLSKESVMATKKTNKRKPSHGIYHVTGEGEAAYWNKIGAAWSHQDGEGFGLSLDYLPLAAGGRLVLRAFPKEDAN
jgi:hypothetical protein